MSNRLRHVRRREKIKEKVRRFLSFHLPLRYAIVILVVCCTVSSLVVVTQILRTNTLFLVVVYGLSILSILFFIQCLRFATILSRIYFSILNLLGRTLLTRKLSQDYSYRTFFFTSLSVVGNTLICISKAYAGWMYSSFWLIILSVYYIILVIIKTVLVHSGQKKNTMTRHAQIICHEWRVYNACGKMVLVLAAILQILVIMTVNYRENTAYNENIIYLMAAYDFYCIFSTGYHTFSKKKKHTPITKAIKAIAFFSSLVSLLSLQIAMSTLSHSVGKEAFFSTMETISGTVICLFVFVYGLNMMHYSKKELKQLEEVNDSDISRRR